MSSPGSERDELLLLIDEWCEGRLDALKSYELKELLRTDPHAAQLFVEYADLRATLALHVPNPSHEQLERAVLRSLEPRDSRLWWFLGTAAAALILCVAGLWVNSRRPAAPVVADDPSEMVPAPHSPAPSHEEHRRPPVVAALRYLPGKVEWLDSPLEYQVDMELRGGDSVEILDGVAEICFVSGARAYLAGQLDRELGSLTLRSPMSCVLNSGQATFDVPEYAQGFEVVTTTGRVVDLGTSFGVTVVDPDHSEVHVFGGRIEAAAHGGDSLPIPLARGSAAMLSGTDSPVRIPFAPEKYLRPLSYASGIESFSSNVLYLPDPPSSLLREGLGRIGWPILVPERQRVVVPRQLISSSPAVRWSGRAPGLASRSVVEDGMEVDSFLLHCSFPEGPGRQSAPVEGEIRFQRPILAVIAEVDQLDESRPWFGVPNAEYPVQSRLKGFGLEVDESFQDLVELSADRRTVRFRLLAIDRNLDQFRILIASRSPQPAEEASDGKPAGAHAGDGT